MANQKAYKGEGNEPKRRKKEAQEVRILRKHGKYERYRAQGRTEISRAKKRLRHLRIHPNDMRVLAALNSLPAYAIVTAQQEAPSLSDVV